MVETEAARLRQRATDASGGRARPGSRRHRGGASGGLQDRDASEIHPGRSVDRPRWWGSRTVLGYRRWVGGGSDGKPSGDSGDQNLTELLDPTSELEATTRPLARRPDSLDGKTVGLLDISKPRGDVFLDRI